MKELRNLVRGITLRTKAVLRRGDRERVLSLGDFAWRDSREMGETRWRRGTRREAFIDLAWRFPSTNRVELQSAVTGRDQWALSEYVFEVRMPARSGERLTWPFLAGAIVPVDRFDAARTLELTYPVYASMQWVDVFGGGRGRYAATHDAEPYFKHLRVHVERPGGRRMVVLEFHYTDLEWPPGKEWVSPPLVLAEHGGDWRDGARIYQTWADGWFRHDPVPDWLKRSNGHNMISFPHGGGRVPFRRLAELARRSRSLGLRAIHVADWMEEGFDTFYPAFQPDPALGGPRGLRKAVRETAEAGMWTCLYFNGRILDPAGPHGRHAFDWAVKVSPKVKRRFAEMWKRTQDRSLGGWDPGTVVPEKPAPFNRDGSAAEEWWGRTFAAVCPTVPAWQNLWLSRMTDIVGTHRPRMIQVDQVCGCWGLPCYDHHHPHHSPALAWSGYKEFTWKMRRQAQTIDPEIGMWTEGVNDILGQAFDGLQANLGFDSLLAGIGEWDPRIFRYTFPEYLLVSGDLNGTDLRRLAWAIVLGSQYHFFIPDSRRLDPAARRWVRFATRVRARHWRAFTSHDVSVPEIGGDDSVRVLAYRAGRRTLLVGAPFDRQAGPDRPFEVSITLPVTGEKLLRCDWAREGAQTSVRLRKCCCHIKGRGPFAISIA